MKKQALNVELIKVSAWRPEDMEAGNLFLLSNRYQLELEKEGGPDSFWAVLACPRCGTLGLIRKSQYNGAVSIICGSGSCSCSFFINGHASFELVPAQ